MPAVPKPSSGHRDWRAQSRPKVESTGVKYVRRLILTLLVAAAAGALVYLLLSSPAEIHFAVLPVSESDVLTLPPIPYAREGAEALKEFELRPPVVDLQDIQTAGGIRTLAGKLREGLHKTDTLIVYLTGNCVSDVGPDGPVAWLLCSDFAVSRDVGGVESKPPGRYRLRDVLMQMKQCPAKSKLLVLDSGYLNYDPRLSLFVNEFPRLLEEDVRAADDPDLWVLCSCRPTESSHTCGPARQSVFNYFVAEGFTAAANSGRRWVDLEHLFVHVRDHVAGWVDRQSGSTETQTPWLLHRSGVDKPPKDYRLVPVLIRKPPPKAAEGEAAAEGAPPPTKPSPAAVLGASLADAWQRRDRLQNRALSGGGWTPADYAPHLWREYQELLLAIDRRSRAGVAFDAANMTNQIAQDLAVDEKFFLQAAAASPALARSQTIASRLTVARNQFLDRLQSDRYFTDATPLREAIQWKNDLLMRAPYYVRWNTAAARSSSGHTASGRGPIDQELARMLPLLGTFVTALESAQTAAASPQGKTALPGQIADSLEALKDSYRSIEQAIEDKVKALEQHPDAAAVAALLDTPLPSAAARKRLLAAREKIVETLPGEKSQNSLALPSPAAWTKTVRQQAELERQLVLLANPEFRFTSLDALGPAAPNVPDTSAADDRFWKTYRQFGQELGGFYRGLPDGVRKEIAARDSSAANRCDRYVRLVDARDAAVVPEEVLSVILPHPQAPHEPRLVVQADVPRTADADGQYVIKLAIDKTDLPARYGLITFDYPRDDLALSTADGKQGIAPDEPFRTEIRSDHAQLIFKARARKQTGEETSLAITVRCGEKTRQSQVRLVLPQPDVVLLRAFRLAGKLDGSTQRRQESESVLQFDRLAPQRLEPFPNRPTTYTFEMVNRSGLGKKLLVRTYLLPAWFWDRNMTCRQACEILAQSATLLGESAVELADLEKPQKVAFPAIKPPPKKADEKPPEKPPAEPPKPKVDVPSGLAMVVCDARSKEPEPKWIQTYIFAPLRPARYLDPTARYDTEEGKLEIAVALAADRDIPPCSQKAPVRLTMAVRDSAGRAVKMLSQPGGTGLPGQTKALLYPGLARDALYALVRSDGRDTLRVELNVDDYPRAFLYEVGLNRVTSQRDLWRVRITDPPRDPIRAMQPRDTLPVAFQVDAPEDSFVTRGARGPGDDAVLLEIFDEQHPETSRAQRFSSDRQVKVELEEADAPGEMKVAAKVDDFTTELDAHGLENVIARVHAQIVRDRQPKDEDSVRVILDGRPPDFELALASPKVAKGESIRVTANVIRSLSDMTKFDYGLQGDAEKQFAGKAKSVDVRGRSAAFALPTKELDPGEYTVLVRGENKAGNFDFRALKVDVVEPASAAQPGEKKITVRGTVRWLDGSPAAGVEVSIETPARSAKTDAQGQFSIGDLPRGSYALKATGSTGGMKASGKATADPGDGDTAEVQISLSSLNR
jgi:hypothetical protein